MIIIGGISKWLVYIRINTSQMRILVFSHAVFPALISFIYMYFLLLLVCSSLSQNQNIWFSILLLLIFFLLYVLYNVAIYSLFHHQPGYESWESVQGYGIGQGEILEIKMSVNKIGEYKQNERRLRELTVLMRENISFDELNNLRKEYMIRYQQLAFCNDCSIIKSPRTSHCRICNRCILRREKHSELVGMCIGLKNMKFFIQYLFIAMVLSLYMVISLIVIVILENRKFDQFKDWQLVVFALFEVVMGASILLFGKQFFISYFNAFDNITQVERKLDIITSILLVTIEKNNPFKNEQYYTKMFHSNFDLFRIQEIGDPNTWFQFYDEGEDNRKNQSR